MIKKDTMINLDVKGNLAKLIATENIIIQQKTHKSSGKRSKSIGERVKINEQLMTFGENLGRVSPEAATTARKKLGISSGNS